MVRRWLIRIGLIVAAPLAFLLLLEGGLAVAGVHVPRYTGFQDQGAYWVPCQVKGRPAGYDRVFPRNYRKFPEPLPLFVRDKPANGWRVFVLGESSVKGLPYETGCFTDWLRLRATAMLPGRRVEVVNAGNVGWHATDIRNLAQECLEHEPDLLVWMVGHNEFTPHNVLTLRREVEHPVQHALRCAVSRLRTAQWLSRYLPALRPPREAVFDHLQSDERPCYGPELALLKQRFREATAGVVADAQAAGVPIVLCTMVRNLRDSPPSYSAFSDATRTVTIKAPTGCTVEAGDTWRVYNGYFSAEGTFNADDAAAGKDTDRVSVAVAIRPPAPRPCPFCSRLPSGQV